MLASTGRLTGRMVSMRCRKNSRDMLSVPDERRPAPWLTRDAVAFAKPLETGPAHA